MDVEQPDVGVVGLGAMGSRMVRRLVAAGHKVAIFDVNQATVRALAGDGVVSCESARGVADISPVVLVSLPDPSTVQKVACSKLVRGHAITTYVDLSTTGPEIAERVADVFSKRGIQCLDAPVSGGAVGAENGSLTIMAAGEARTLEAVRPFLEHLGSTIIHVGTAPGQGQTVKLANNLLSATAIAATAEVLLIGAKSGIDLSTMLDVFNVSSGRNTATAHKFPKFVLPRTFASDFRLALMAKDVHLCVDEATRQGVALQLGSVVNDMWSAAAHELPEDTDATAIVTKLEAQMGVILQDTPNLAHETLKEGHTS